ncbi:MAG: zinc-ribbon domain-containing protein [SAR202 cluster bacterium]|nr:zinc-ribbon domain-containing protein [SAR202 cluster bacterium]
MFCSNCGKEAQQGASFCAHCGARLAVAPAGTEAATGAVPASLAPPAQALPPAPKYADFWKRLLAFLLDSAILSAVTGMLSFIFFPLLLGMPGFSDGTFWSPAMTDEEMLAFFVAFLVLGVAFFVVSTTVIVVYGSIMESSKQQGTVGKMVLGLYVTDMEGRRLTFGRALGRNLGKIVSNMTFYVGYIMAAFTEKKQGLHDYMAGTLVWEKNI